MNVVAFIAGLLVVLFTVVGVIFVLILPRPPTGIARLSLFVIRGVHGAFTLLSRLARRYETKDAILAPVAPFALVTQLLTWAGGLVIGFALMLVPVTHSFPDGLTQSLTALFTVGAVHVGGRPDIAIDIAAGSTWVVIVALQIAYLPSLYSKYAHREGLVTMLETRAGSPTWGPELLIRHHFAGVEDSIADLYGEWERWAAEVSESHATYPVLMYFRSPDPWLSWVVGLVTVLDAAALQSAVAPSTVPANARMLLTTGFVTFQKLAASMGWVVERNPGPDTPIELTYEEFARAVGLLQTYGVRVERSVEEAWPHFRGWRVNYEAPACRLANYLTAPPAPWAGDRTHVDDEDMASHHPPHQLLDRSTGGLTPGRHSRT